MTILLVEDETGIREGLAAYLGLKGHEVHAVGSVPEALERLAAFGYQVVVTDWRLQGETARPILEAAGREPCVVISGSPEEVDQHPAVRRILSKPVRPGVLVAELDLLLVAVETTQRASQTGARGSGNDEPGEIAVLAGARGLSREVQAVLATAAALLPAGAEGTLHDRGGVVEVEFGPVPEAVAAALERLGGDLQVDAASGCAHWRLFADGRPAGIERVVRLDPDRPESEPWPSRPFAVDCEAWAADATRLAERIESAGAAGCVAILGLEPSMRRALHALEVTLPTRLPPGPEIGGPEALLWASA